MQPLSSWNDEEYATVAIALRYPASRLGAQTVGYSPTVTQAYALGPKLEQIPPSMKPRVVLLAQQVTAAEDKLTAQALGGGDDCDDREVIQVGDIKFDRSIGVDQTSTQADRLRRRLAEMIDFPVNTSSVGGTTSGGINGTWST